MSVPPSIRPVLSETDEKRCYDGRKFVNDIINNDTKSDDDVVSSDVPTRYLFINRKPFA